MAEIYKWFTEGFDTLDLKDAKALLEEFSRAPSWANTDGRHYTPGGPLQVPVQAAASAWGVRAAAASTRRGARAP